MEKEEEVDKKDDGLDERMGMGLRDRAIVVEER